MKATELHELETFEPTGISGKFIRKQTRTVYIDLRYEAKLRLFIYVNFKKKGFKPPKYSPYEGTEIGKSIGILQNY